MSESNGTDIAAAYEYCRQIAKREAKNFYYAFRVLPKHKSDAMCAVYAFMRKADDLSDEESLLLEVRRRLMSDWTEAWKTANVDAGEDLVFLALKDTQRRFGISNELLEQLVAGTTLDLYDEQSGTETVTLRVGKDTGEQSVQIYRSFDDLYHYCYLVASVVGLVCIRIFGYTDPRAEEHAERVGIAFQLTNILRDVVEDSQRGRVYLPMDDLRQSSVTPQELLIAAQTGSAPKPLVEVLQKEIGRAEDYYASVEHLVPLLDADSRVAMQVLASIYQQLLKRIALDPAAVMRKRVSVPTHRKLFTLAGGLVRAQLVRRRA